jgi:phenylalanyl-tRNA synthetase beta chain
VADDLREVLIGLGFQEAITNPMLDEKKATLDGGKPVRILNPRSNEMTMLRTSLVPGLLDSVAHNMSFGNENMRLFEIGHVFSFTGTSVEPLSLTEINEQEVVSLVITGLSAPRNWSLEGKQADIYDLKGEAMNLLAKFALDKSLFISYSTSNCLAENPIAVEINGGRVGYLGSVRAEVLKLFGIEQQVFVAELSLKAFAGERSRKYQPLPRFPRVRRDVAFIVDEGTTAREVEDAIRESSSKLLQRIDLFDVYEGENVPRGKKSLAFALELMSHEKTLTDPEIESEVRLIVQQVEKRLGAALRSL